MRDDSPKIGTVGSGKAHGIAANPLGVHLADLKV
jgi:hypothetical protein